MSNERWAGKSGRSCEMARRPWCCGATGLGRMDGAIWAGNAILKQIGGTTRAIPPTFIIHSASIQ